MFGFERSGSFQGRSSDLWTAAVGAGAGLIAGAATYLLTRRRTQAQSRAAGPSTDREIASAISSDADLAGRGIAVGRLGDGIVELSGTVDTEHEARRAVEIAQDVPGVRTVLNRLGVAEVEDRLAANRRQYDAGEPGMHEHRWYGMGVGTGRRRQGHRTDPDRPDDKVPIQSDELGTDRALEATSEDVDKLAPGGEDHTSANAAPTDRARYDQASHRRLGNVPEDSLQDLNPESGVHENVKKGTEITLEESGLTRPAERERGRRRAADGGRGARRGSRADAPDRRRAGEPARESEHARERRSESADARRGEERR